MSLEALWTVEFVSNREELGAGVIMFVKGRMFGGRDGAYFLGSYELTDGVLDGEIEVTRFSGKLADVMKAPSWYGVFPELQSRFHVRLRGELTEPIMDLAGYIVEDPSKKLLLRCEKRAELP